MKKAAALLAALLLLSACAAEQTQTETSAETSLPATETKDQQSEESEMKLWINKTEVPVTWEENDSVQALRALASGDGLEISMSMYGGFEQVGSIGRSLPRDDRQTTTAAGDIVLYSGSQLVIFYGSNSWAYTRLGHVERAPEDMAALLGGGDVTVRIAEG